MPSRNKDFPDNRGRDEKRSSRPSFEPLSKEDINNFFDDLDKDKDGFVTFDELEAKLESVHEQIAPEPQEHHLNHPQHSKTTGNERLRDEEKGHVSAEHDGLHAFLCHLMPDCSGKMDRETFTKQVGTWNIPSPKQTSSEDVAKKDAEYEKHMTIGRRIKAHWSVEGPQYLFLAFVTAAQIAFAVWQGVKYIQNPLARAALGWGVIMAKFSAGALYPTLFFVFLSMSRWFSTFMRKSYWISRFINWDHSQKFHIIMSCEAYALAFLHAIGHLTGTFLYGSRPGQQDDLARVLGDAATPKSYRSFIASTPGWTGLVAFGLFTIIVITSMPVLRRKNYEIFQLFHLLMYPFAVMLCLHGTASLLQPPALGYVLAFPLALVIFERSLRLVRGFIRIPARMTILDKDTVSLTLKNDSGWRYQAGQWIYLQVPQLSFFQWHPFTISACSGNLLQVHIKCEKGGWTSQLRDLPTDQDVPVGLDGPFGAPAQRFYNFDRSIVMGAGIGVTPFSAILSDIEQKVTGRADDPWRSGRKSRHGSRSTSRTPSRRASRASSRTRVSSGTGTTRSDGVAPPIMSGHARHHNRGGDGDVDAAALVDSLRHVQQQEEHEDPSSYMRRDDQGQSESQQIRRVDFIWTVREKNNLLWFSSLLNRVHDLSKRTRPALQINIKPYITAKREGISTHVFRYLLDRYRTETSPVSALTGLTMESHFGRPDMDKILSEFHDETRRDGFSGKVGVFFCGSPMVGRLLSDACAELTARSRVDGSDIRYMFMMEVFG